VTSGVVFQTLMGACGGATGRSLCSHPKELVDDSVLGEDVSLGNSFKLAFEDPVDGFIALKGSVARSAGDLIQTSRRYRPQIIGDRP
jgi:hypothetical protein